MDCVGHRIAGLIGGELCEREVAAKSLEASHVGGRWLWIHQPHWT
jgi:hypothetical protein